jgi:hypothetical protein
LGFGVGPKAWIDKMTDIKGNHDFGSSNLTQQIVKRVVRGGLFDRHRQLLLDTYRKKRDIVLQILEEHFPRRPLAASQRRILHLDRAAAPHGFRPQSDIFQTALQEKVLYVPAASATPPTAGIATVVHPAPLVRNDRRKRIARGLPKAGQNVAAVFMKKCQNTSDDELFTLIPPITCLLYNDDKKTKHGSQS